MYLLAASLALEACRTGFIQRQKRGASAEVHPWPGCCSPCVLLGNPTCSSAWASSCRAVGYMHLILSDDDCSVRYSTHKDRINNSKDHVKVNHTSTEYSLQGRGWILPSELLLEGVTKKRWEICHFPWAHAVQQGPGDSWALLGIFSCRMWAFGTAEMGKPPCFSKKFTNSKKQPSRPCPWWWWETPLEMSQLLTSFILFYPTSIRTL